MPRFHPVAGELPAAPGWCGRHRSGRCRRKTTGIPKVGYLRRGPPQGRQPTPPQGRVSTPHGRIRRQPQAGGVVSPQRAPQSSARWGEIQGGADQHHKGADQRPLGHVGQNSEAPTNDILLSSHRAEKKKKRPPRPNAEGGGRDETPPKWRRLIARVGRRDRCAHSTPPPSFSETELDSAGLRRPSSYYTTFRVK